MGDSKKIPVDELRALKQLLDDQVITQAEFEEKKKQLLGLTSASDKGVRHISIQQEAKQDITKPVETKVVELVDSFNEVKDKESKDAFIEKLADSIAESFPEPYDDTGFINDEDYGLSATKPIRVSGVVQEESYLKFLNNQLGKPFFWERTTSLTIEGMNGVVDAYEGTYNGETITIYINPYGVLTTDTIPKGLRKLMIKQNGSAGKEVNPFVLDKVRASINSSPYANVNEINWISDFNLTYRSVDIDSISPPFDILWNSLEYYYSQKIGMNLKGLVVSFSDVVRVQSLYKIANAFAVMLAVFLESINNKQELKPITIITLPFAFWLANDFEELNGTINEKIKAQVITEHNCFAAANRSIDEYEDWFKDYVDDTVLDQIKATDAGKNMIMFGDRLLKLCEEKKKVKEGFLGLNTKTVRVPNPQLRNDIAVFLTKAIPNIMEEITPFIKPKKEGK